MLLTKSGQMKLADFGASKRYDTASVVSGLKGREVYLVAVYYLFVHSRYTSCYFIYFASIVLFCFLN